MKLNAGELELIREYLLGRSPEEDRTQIEQRLLTDADYFQEILIGEEELIDEYVADQLSESDRQAFETKFLVTVERQKQLHFARRWKKYVGETTKTTVDEGMVTQPFERSVDSVDSHPKKRLFFSFFPAQSPILSYSLAVAVLLAVVGVSWVAVRDWSTPHGGAGNTLAVTLTPGLSRGDGELPRIKLSPDLESVELRLVLQKSDHRVYRSVLLDDDRSQIWISGDLMAVNDAGTNFVVSSVPAKLLAPGDYRVAVSGRSSDNAFEDIATYSFRVMR